MAAIKDMIRQRTASLLIVAVIAVVVTVIADRGVVGGAVAAAVALVVVLALVRANRAADREGPTQPVPTSDSGAFEWSYRWDLEPAPPPATLATAVSETTRLDVVSTTADEAVLRGGSQLHYRLIGGSFGDPSKLPVEARIRVQRNADRDQVELVVRDAVGPIIVRDGAMRDRFQLAAEQTRSALDLALQA
jgi:hypothetical protein